MVPSGVASVVGWLRSTVGAIVPQPPAGRAPPPEDQDETLEPIRALATKLAAATVVVTGILTFFGIKDSALDAILRKSPKSVVLFGVAIGFGILSGLVVAQIAGPNNARFDRLMREYPAAATIVLAAFLIGLYPFLAAFARTDALPRIGAGLWLTWAGALAVLVLAGLFLRGSEIPLILSLLVIGAELFCLGTYGVTRLAIDSKNTSIAPRIETPVIARREDGLLHITATLRAAGLLSCFEVEAFAGPVRLADIHPDSTGNVDHKLDVPLVPAMSVDRLSVPLRANLTPSGGRCSLLRQESADAGASQRTEVTLPLVARPPAPVISAKWLNGGASLEVTTSSVPDDSGDVARLTVMQRRGAECQVIGLTLIPVAVNGALSHISVFDVPNDADEVEVRGEFSPASAPITPGRLACPVPQRSPSMLLVRRPLPVVAGR